MTIQIDGTSGISGVDGSATTPALQGTDTNTGISFGTDEVNVVTGGSTRATVDSNGRLLVGTSTEGVSGGDQLTIAASGHSGMTIRAGTSDRSSIYMSDGTSGTAEYRGYAEYDHGSDYMRFGSAATERLRIRSDGAAAFYNCAGVFPNTDNNVGLGFSANRWAYVYAANGTIQTSDRRAKTEIADASLGSDFIKDLRPVSYKWIEGGKRSTGEQDENGNYTYESVPGERTHWGFIAQEVKQAVETAGVDFGGWVLADKNDSDSEQALRYDQFIAPLTKALQEALAKIETLETRVAQLEGGVS